MGSSKTNDSAVVTVRHYGLRVQLPSKRGKKKKSHFINNTQKRRSHCCLAGFTGPSIATRLAAGCTTGALAVAVAQPTDVVKVRFQAQVGLLRGGAANRYSGTLDAYRTIARDEGLRGLWKGNGGAPGCILLKWGGGSQPFSLI